MCPKKKKERKKEKALETRRKSNSRPVSEFAGAE
jgi:hypothetical protein